jgi:hypothetical protein
MEKKLILGYSTNSMKNIILNKEKQWFAFTVNNKIVIEFLEESRSQLILEEHLDEVSVSELNYIYYKTLQINFLFYNFYENLYLSYRVLYYQKMEII